MSSTRGDWKAHASKKASTTNFIVARPRPCRRRRRRRRRRETRGRGVVFVRGRVLVCARNTNTMDKTNDFFFFFFFLRRKIFRSFVRSFVNKRYGVKHENAPTAKKTSIQNAPSSSSKEARYKQHATTKAWSGKRLVNRLK